MITGFETHDVRFPTSRHLDGSDAMNPFPDYSAAYLVLRTDGGDQGHSLVFTIGRGNDVQIKGIKALAPLVIGRTVEDIAADLGGFARSLSDSQLRWLGPEKGVILHAARVGRSEREAALRERGYPAYTTTPGWLGYDDEKLTRLSKQAVADGFSMIKIKVGANPEDDVRRLSVARNAVGPAVPIAVDANQVWGIREAITWVRRLAPFNPYWIEEPTSPDEVLGLARIRAEVRPVRVATGEHVANPVVFKQLLQADAVDVVQIDACRVGGVRDNVAILLLATKFGVPVCPHAGGVGLCEMVQHLSMFDLLAVSGSWNDRMIEYVDHLHEHFTDPVRIRDGRYVAPLAPGGGARMLPASIAHFTFPDGPAWAGPAEPP
jgi:L-fuconate dehydratase